ncbi:hypothetical protein [Arenibacterium sp. LLYu02]|uniref:hypothetical protein n=1 Tax=Arenibacterium sp. LLYu02 TaxID=3404132 RepID=UPI003B21F013
MRITLGALLVGTLVLSSCGGWRDSRINPTNWFGKSRESRFETPAENVNPLLPQEEEKLNLGGKPDDENAAPDFTIVQIKDLSIARTATGAIVTATGEAARDGGYNAQLIATDPQPEGVLEYTFRLSYPAKATLAGTPVTRSIVAAVSLTNQDLAGVRLIRVVGQENARESRR